MADILENPVDLIDDAYEQEIQVEQEPIEVVAYRSYNQLDDKPQINGVELAGNKTSSDLGITAQINSAVNSEAQTRQQADSALQGKIDAEELARQQADSTIQGKIDAEETARKAADKDIQDVLDGETLARQNADAALGGRIDAEIHDRQVADIGLQGQIDAITSKSDVVDVVATYAALQAYDTQHLGDNDVIKVLDDETHGNALTYYRWSKTNQTWSYIGQEAPYYSKSQTETLLLGKQDKIDSTHKLSADLVDDTNATNKFVTAEDKTNWNAKQNALTAGAGIEIENGVISTPAIVPEVVAELPATGAEGKLYLTPKNYTRSTATGNPIEATVTDGAGTLESFQLDGDTEQATYTGKNLLAFNNEAYVNGNGVTCVWDSGKVTISGTASNNQVFVTGYCVNNLAAGTYTFSLDRPSPRRFIFRTFDANDQTIASYNIEVRETSVQVTMTGNEAKYRIVMLTEGGTTYDETDYFMLEAGTTATTWEKYVGGQASPNPDFPQAVQTVTGEQTVTIVGKNKYPFSDVLWSTTATSTGWRFQDGGANAYGADLVDKTSYKLTLPAGSYTMTAYNIDSNIISIQACKNGADSEVIITDPYNLSSTNLSSTIALTEPTTFCVRYRATNPSLGIGNTKIQIEKSETSTAYTPYKSTDYKINLSDNELEIPDSTLTNNGVKCIMSSNSATITRTSANRNTSFIRYQLDTPLTIHSGETFTLYAGNIDTIGNKTATGNYMSVRLRKSNDTDDTNTDTVLGNINAKTTITATEDVTYTHFVIRTSTYLYPDNLVIAPRLVIGQDNSIELCKLGEYQDYIYKDDNTWKVHKATSKYIFETASGTGANWEVSSHRVYFTANYQNAHSITFAEYTDTTTQAPLLADKFKAISFDDLYVNGKSGVALSSTKTLSIRNNSWTDETTARNEIVGTTMYYALATATDTVITDSDLIAQLEAIRTAALENGANTISNAATGSNLAGDMEISYYGYNPTNRYDKFIWLDLNNNYEQIGE